MHKIKTGIIGVGGYAESHLTSIRFCEQEGNLRLGAAVIRNEDREANAGTEAELVKAGVHIYRSSEDMFRNEKGQLDLISIPIGIDQHADQSVTALESGFNVLCEKPAAGTVADALRMKEAAERTGKILAIGYQYIFSPSIQRIKELTLNRALGKLLTATTYVLWPRNSLYYNRNRWAGKMAVNGKFIYDSPIQNATSHFLNNMLYIAGPTRETSADVISVYGENYRAKDIEAPDTQYLRVVCNEGVVLSHMASHAVASFYGPVTKYIYEKGKIEWIVSRNGLTRVYKKNGVTGYELDFEFDNGEEDLKNNIYVYVLKALVENRAPLSNIFNSIQQVLCVNKAFESSGGPVPVSEEYLQRLDVEPEPGSPDVDRPYNIVIKGGEEVIRDMFDREVGFFEYGLPWAVESKTVFV